MAKYIGCYLNNVNLLLQTAVQDNSTCDFLKGWHFRKDTAGREFVTFTRRESSDKRVSMSLFGQVARSSFI